MTDITDLRNVIHSRAVLIVIGHSLGGEVYVTRRQIGKWLTIEVTGAVGMQSRIRCIDGAVNHEDVVVTMRIMAVDTLHRKVIATVSVQVVVWLDTRLHCARSYTPVTQLAPGSVTVLAE